MSEPNVCRDHEPDGLKNTADRVVSSKSAVEMAILHLIRRYQIDVSDLLEKTSGQTDIIASEPTYLAIAPVVGLDPERNMRDANEFSVTGARIPTTLLRAIIGDLHIAINQYGPRNHGIANQVHCSGMSFPIQSQPFQNYEPILTQIINRIVAQFKLSFRTFQSTSRRATILQSSLLTLSIDSKF